MRLRTLSLILITLPTVTSASEQKKQVESKALALQSIALKGHTAPIIALTKLSDKPLSFASADTKGTLKVWSILGNCFTTITPKKASPVKAIAGLSDTIIATLASPTKEGIWNLNTSNDAITETVVSFAEEPSPEIDTITLWDIETGKAIQTGKGLKYRDRKDHTWFSFEALDSDQQYITLQNEVCVGYVQSWITKETKPVALDTFSIVTPHTFPMRKKITAYAWLNPKRTAVAIGGEDGSIRILVKGAKTAREGSALLEGPKGSVTALAKLSDTQLASASEDGTIFVWDLTTGRAQIYPGHTQAVRTLLPLSPTQFLSGSDDMTIRVWTITPPEVEAKQKEEKAKASQKSEKAADESKH